MTDRSRFYDVMKQISGDIHLLIETDRKVSLDKKTEKQLLRRLHW